ncbi:MAG TPA: hypothetical protein DCZ94_16375 [Lentisphaeria bacterium]|nr:MAG: hypothetical protein A2X48_01960 [Lentisphaerae bacterium GWF2_49_21]HBC88524.1 hypothetical protein [Lentisphaeria bacterium]
MQKAEIEVRALTKGPHHHYFGYYDKFCWNKSQGLILAHRIDFTDRPLTKDDKAEIGVIEESTGKFEKIAETRAWCWQQGAMLQWYPAEPEGTIMYNDNQDGQYVCVIKNIRTGKERVLPRPVASVSRNGKWSMSINFSRLAVLRPGYGYEGIPDPFGNEDIPKDDGIFWMNNETGKNKLIISTAQIAAFKPESRMDGRMHRFNHLQFSPDDKRFIFLHRYKKKEDHDANHITRLYTADIDGGSICLLNENDFTSHFDWKDSSHVIAFAARSENPGWKYFLFTDQSEEVKQYGTAELSSFGDGHCSFAHNGSIMMTDTYSRGDGNRMLMFYNDRNGDLFELGRFYSQPWITQARCDLHPRWSRDGMKVCFDSSHEGTRQIYVADVSGLIEKMRK